MDFPRRRRVVRLGAALSAAVAVVLGLLGCSSMEDAGTSETAKAEVGDCINVIENTVAGSTVDSKTEPVECTAQNAVYRVMETHASKTECAAGQASYEESLNGGTTAFLCLAPDFTEGSCYAEGNGERYTHVDCASATASFRVMQRIDGATDELSCAGSANRFITVSDPKTTFCLGEANA